MQRKVVTPLGIRHLDLQELIGWADTQGVGFAFLTQVVNEVEGGLTSAIWDEFGGTFSAYKLTRYEKRARKKWGALEEQAGSVNRPASNEDIAEARTYFEARSRQMTRPGKNPVPDRNDLKILMQLKTVEGETHFVTRDEHFLVYRDLIASKWNVNIHNGARLNLLLDEWRMS